jgi:oligopeptide transport system substrate-binding protein
MKKVLSALLAVSALSLGVAACQKKAAEAAPRAAHAATGTVITAVFKPEPNTIDPALSSTVDGAIYLGHLFEGLYKYEDNGESGSRAGGGRATESRQQ